jgi:hypothetical protein
VYNGGAPVEGAWQTSTVSDPTAKFWVRRWRPGTTSLNSYFTLEQWYADDRINISAATYVYAVNYG